MKLELYKKESCPYCQRVLGYLRESGRTDVELKDVVEEPSNYDRVRSEGGKEQVPCLFVDGAPMYESMDIIAFLEAHPQES